MVQTQPTHTTHPHKHPAHTPIAHEYLRRHVQRRALHGRVGGGGRSSPRRRTAAIVARRRRRPPASAKDRRAHGPAGRVKQLAQPVIADLVDGVVRRRRLRAGLLAAVAVAAAASLAAAVAVSANSTSAAVVAICLGGWCHHCDSTHENIILKK
jgi:hypothetical protein